MDDKQITLVLSKILTQHVNGIKRDTLSKYLQRLAAECLVTETKESKVTEKHAKEIFEVFTFWRETFKKPENCKLTTKRRAKIKGRLEDGYKTDDIKKGILNISISPYHMGKNEQKKVYDDIEMICRSDHQLQKYIEMSQSESAYKEVQKADSARLTLRDQLRQAMKENDDKKVKELTERLKQ